MKNIKILIFAILITISSFLSISALPDTSSYDNGIYVIDELEEISKEDIDKLNLYADDISKKMGFNIIYIQSKDCDNMDTFDYALKAVESGSWDKKPYVILVYNQKENNYASYVHKNINFDMSPEELDMYIDDIWDQMFSQDSTMYLSIEYYIQKIAMMYDEFYNDNKYFSKNTSGESEETDKKRPLLVDNADLIADEKEYILLDKAQSISEKYNIDVAIITVFSLGGYSSGNLAEKLYYEYGYGKGKNKDGMVLLISSKDRDYSLFKKGKPHYLLSNKKWENSIIEPVLEILSTDEYQMAFETYLQESENLFSKVREDGNLPMIPVKPIYYFYGILVAFALASIVVSIGASSLKSVNFNLGANDYFIKDSLNVKDFQDRFLSRNVVRTEIPKDNDRSSGGSSSDSSSTSGKY